MLLRLIMSNSIFFNSVHTFLQETVVSVKALTNVLLEITTVTKRLNVKTHKALTHVLASQVMKEMVKAVRI